MRKLFSAGALLLLLAATTAGEVRIGGLITPKSISETSGPLGQALFVSVGSQSSRFELFSDVSLFRSENSEEGDRHVEDALTVLLGYRRTFPVDAVNPSLTFRVGYQREVIDDRQTFFGDQFGVRLADEGAIGMLGVGVEYRLHRRIMLGVEAGLWGMIRDTKDSNWEVGIQFPMITASYSIF